MEEVRKKEEMARLARLDRLKEQNEELRRQHERLKQQLRQSVGGLDGLERLCMRLRETQHRWRLGELRVQAFYSGLCKPSVTDGSRNQ